MDEFATLYVCPQTQKVWWIWEEWGIQIISANPKKIPVLKKS